MIFPFVLFSFLCCGRTNMNSKFFCNISTMNVVFFFQVSKFTFCFLIILFFQSWSSFVHGCLLCSSLSPFCCSPFLCCERRDMRSKEKLKCWISEHHFFSSEQVHQLPPHDYSLFIMVVLYSWLFCVHVHHPYDVPFLPFFVVEEKT